MLAAAPAGAPACADPPHGRAAGATVRFAHTPGPVCTCHWYASPVPAAVTAKLAAPVGQATPGPGCDTIVTPLPGGRLSMVIARRRMLLVRSDSRKIPSGLTSASSQ